MCYLIEICTWCCLCRLFGVLLNSSWRMFVCVGFFGVAISPWWHRHTHAPSEIACPCGCGANAKANARKHVLPYRNLQMVLLMSIFRCSFVRMVAHTPPMKLHDLLDFDLNSDQLVLLMPVFLCLDPMLAQTPLEVVCHVGCGAES